jgi:hypothetical protein
MHTKLPTVDDGGSLFARDISARRYGSERRWPLTALTIGRSR